MGFYPIYNHLYRVYTCISLNRQLTIDILLRQYYAIPQSLEDLRRELEIPEEVKLFNEDLGELKDVTLLR